MSEDQKSSHKTNCSSRYLTELIGFEGEFLIACSHKEHTHAGEMYAPCTKNNCPRRKQC